MDLLVHTVDLSYSWNAISAKYPIATTSQKKKKKDSTDKQQETKYSGTKVCPKLQLTFSRLFFKSESYIVCHSGSQLHSGSQHQAWPCGPGCPWVFSTISAKMNRFLFVSKTLGNWSFYVGFILWGYVYNNCYYLFLVLGDIALGKHQMPRGL